MTETQLDVTEQFLEQYSRQRIEVGLRLAYLADSVYKEKLATDKALRVDHEVTPRHMIERAQSLQVGAISMHLAISDAAGELIGRYSGLTYEDLR